MFLVNLISREDMNVAHVLCFAGANIGIATLILGSLLSSPIALGASIACLSISLVAGICALPRKTN